MSNIIFIAVAIALLAIFAFIMLFKEKKTDDIGKLKEKLITLRKIAEMHYGHYKHNLELEKKKLSDLTVLELKCVNGNDSSWSSYCDYDKEANELEEYIKKLEQTKEAV